MPALRDYQERAVTAIVEKLQAGRNPVLIAPTGSGKTYCIAAIAQRFGGSVCAMAHRQELIGQIQNTCHAFGVSVFCETWQALARRPARYADLIVVDEGHHAARGTTYAKLIQRYRELNPLLRVLAVTATAWRLDGKGLTSDGLFDDYVIATTPRDLLESGVLVPYSGFAYQAIDTSGVRKVAGDYAQGALAEAAAQPKLLGDIVSRWKDTASNLSTLVFAVNVAHAQALAEEFQAQGVHAEYLTGKDTKQRRQQLFSDIATRRLPVLINVAIATEGVDIPSLECLVLARPTLSETLALQMVGRVLRSHPGKHAARIHDHAQVLQTHGSPFAERDWTPRPDRKRGPSGEGGGGAQQICHECLSIIAAGCRQCPGCGAVLRERPEVAAADGVEVAISSEGIGRTDWDFSAPIDGEYRGSDTLRHYVDGYGLKRTAVLDTAFAAVPRGGRVRVTYLGERTSRVGFRYHNFRVETSTLSARELELLSEA